MIRNYTIRYSNGETRTVQGTSRADAMRNATTWLGVYINGVTEK